MWMGIVLALLLCLATAVCYAEMAKLYPGTGSSYYFAEQSFLNHDKAWRYARLSKFIVGWGSHLYYWIYPGVMVGVMGILCGYLVGTLWPNFMSASNPGPMFMMAGGGRVLVRGRLHRVPRRERLDRGEHRDQRDSDHRAAGVLRDGARLPHEPSAGKRGAFSSIRLRAMPTPMSSRPRRPVEWHRRRTIVRDANGVPKPQAGRRRQAGSVPHQLSRKDDKGNFLHAPEASFGSVAHNWGWMFVQATVAILILVGFESVTAMGGEAKNAKRDVPIAVIMSLLVQGAFCYLFEYFAANYFLNSGYTMQSASGSAAPIGDMMIVVGDAMFGRGTRTHLHAGGGVHGVPGDHRHHAFLHEHRRARHLRDGQGPRSAGALRPAALART